MLHVAWWFRRQRVAYIVAVLSRLAYVNCAQKCRQSAADDTVSEAVNKPALVYFTFLSFVVSSKLFLHEIVLCMSYDLVFWEVG